MRVLADKLLAEGYGIRRTERDFELASVSRELIEKFPKRTLEIERLCKEKYTILEARARKLMRETGMDRQHHSVERGDALRILEKSAAIASAALTKIF